MRNQQFLPYHEGLECIVQNGKSMMFASFEAKQDDCGVCIYNRKTGELTEQIPFQKSDRMGKLRYGTFEVQDPLNKTYLFYDGQKLFPDEKALLYKVNGKYGEQKNISDYKAVFYQSSYDWEQDQFPMTAYEDSIYYGMHVRGFTKHASSGVKNKGTFAGLTEKIPYLKELGVTGIVLQPIYEFPENSKTETERKTVAPVPDTNRLNYWGYTKGFYYAPKAAYSSCEDAVTELKNTVKALHKEHIEIILQMYFPVEISGLEISEILKFWRWEYHIDGFQLMGINLPMAEIAKTPSLSDTKLWYYYIPKDEIYAYEETPAFRNLAIYNDDYLYNIRKFMKGDDGCISQTMQDMRYNPGKYGIIRYLADYSGFTIADLFSYDRKHNEDNGEDNRDGNDHNCSWNCGVEGPSRKKAVVSLRNKMQKNAFTLLLLNQGTPYFFMGDEFGRSQKGNNNPYCQDNSITWVDWKDADKNKSLLDYVKSLITLRQQNKIFHMPKELRLMDYSSCGYPDLSYHGSEAWKPGWEAYNHHMGMMLAGSFGGDTEEHFWYIAMNMHWEEHEFALPRLPKDQEWKVYLSTDTQESLISDNLVSAGARSVVIFQSRKL